MTTASNPGDRPLDLSIAAAAVPIPRDHPAYSGGSNSPRPATRRWPTTLATVAGLLSIAAFSGGAAHYMLRIAEPRGQAPLAVAAALPAQPTPAPAPAEEPAPAIALASPEPAPLPASDLAAAPPADAAPPAAITRPRKRAIKATKLLSLAQRQKPALAPEGENLAFVPQEVILPAPIFPPREPIVPTPKADR